MSHVPPAINPFSSRFIRPDANEFLFVGDATVDGDQSKGDQIRALVGQITATNFSLVVGDHGTGKSTLLATLLPELQGHYSRVAKVLLHAPGRRDVDHSLDGSGLTASSESGGAGVYARLRNVCTCWNSISAVTKDLPPGSLLVVDGLEQLDVLSRQRLLIHARRRKLSILATSHLAVRGFRVVYRSSVSAELVTRLTDRLLAGAPAGVDAAVRRELQSGRLDSVSNVRDLWFELYDLVAELHSRQL